MLTQVADGVHVHESRFVQSNAVVVEGDAGVLLIDPGVHEDELSGLAAEVAGAGRAVVAGFSTHPHWDHLLWHPALGDAGRWGTALCASTASERLANGVDRARFGIPDDVPFGLLGDIAGLPAGADRIPWAGPEVRILEHRAHAPGHAALLIADRGVLIAGDMLSDVLIPMLDVGAEDPIGDHLAALDLFESVADEVQAVVPGHGSVGGAGALRERLDRDRAYLEAVRSAAEPDDSRIGPDAKPGWEWVADLHAHQVAALTRES